MLREKDLGIFEFFQRNRTVTKPGPEDKSFRVPENVSLEVYGKPPPPPTVARMAGGGLIASMGITSDQPEGDLKALLAAIKSEIDDQQPDIFLSGAPTLKAACRETSAVSNVRAIFWVLNAEVFAIWSCGSSLLQSLLYSWARGLEQGILPVIFVPEPKSAAGEVLGTLLGELGLTARAPEDDGSIVIEVHRDKGVIVSCILGESFPASGKRSEWFEDICNRRFQAERDGGEAKCEEIDAELTAFLDDRLLPAKTIENRTPEFATHLRALLWDIANGDEGAFEALLQCLVEREAELVFPIDTSRDTAMFTEWPGQGCGLEVFPDLCLAREALCADDPGRSVALGNLPSVDVLKWMARENVGLAIRIGDPDEPSRALYVDHKKIVYALRNYSG